MAPTSAVAVCNVVRLSNEATVCATAEMAANTLSGTSPMMHAQVEAGRGSTLSTADFDAVIVGAGFAGLYMLHRLRKLGFSAKFTRLAQVWAVPGFGTATPARAATSKVWSTRIPSPKSCSGSGGGRNATLPNQRSFDISTT